MNELEQDHASNQPDEGSDSSEAIATDQPVPEESAAAEDAAVAEPATISMESSQSSERPKRNDRPKRSNSGKVKGRKSDQRSPARPLAKRIGVFRRVVFVSWSGEREPASELLWAEATIEGDWVIVQKLEKVRTRKEILDRILEMDAGLVTLDFNFSYPAAFLEMLTATEGIADWRSMIRTVREDLKKNVDDGARLWVERLGRYRESYLDPETPKSFERPSRRPNDRGWNFQQQSNIQPKRLEPHEQQSLAERFRRTDLPVISLAGRNTMSTIQIGYNRLTERYEFNGNSRGKDALLGMAMLSQLLEAGNEDLSIWPMMELKKLTIVETLPWLFTEGKRIEPGALATMLVNYEDAGWYIPDEIQKSAAKNAKAQQALLTLLGILKTELRMLRNRFPIRYYSPTIYRDAQVQLEGWTYGMNYRVADHREDHFQHEAGQPEAVPSDAIPAES
jgi:hypothetical protein